MVLDKSNFETVDKLIQDPVMSACVLPKPRISLLTQDERKNAENAIQKQRTDRTQAEIKKENIRRKQQEKVLKPKKWGNLFVLG